MEWYRHNRQRNNLQPDAIMDNILFRFERKHLQWIRGLGCHRFNYQWKYLQHHGVMECFRWYGERKHLQRIRTVDYIWRFDKRQHLQPDFYYLIRCILFIIPRYTRYFEIIIDTWEIANTRMNNHGENNIERGNGGEIISTIYNKLILSWRTQFTIW